jgi:tripartite-type tricarboxylate transporter receptor subunit TctC
MITRRDLVLAATASVAAGRSAIAQDNWPSKPVRLIIGFPAGGPTDFGGRLLQDPLGRLWGQPLVIENRAGASQVIASEAVARSAPDGYTLFLAASTHTSNAAVYTRLPYDTLNDFTPIVNLYASPTVLFVGRNSPLRSAQDLVAAAKREPGMTFGTSGNGVSGHFATEMFRAKVSIEVTVVAFRGAAPALQEVVAGRVAATFSTLSGAIGLVREGVLRPLAVGGPQRVEVLPEVPTLAELGMGIPDTSPWYGFMGPKGLPRPIVDRVSNDVLGLLRDPAIARRIVETGGLVLAEGPAAFDQRIRSEVAENAVVAREAGIRVE